MRATVRPTDASPSGLRGPRSRDRDLFRTRFPGSHDNFGGARRDRTGQCHLARVVSPHCDLCPEWTAAAESNRANTGCSRVPLPLGQRQIAFCRDSTTRYPPGGPTSRSLAAPPCTPSLSLVRRPCRIVVLPGGLEPPTSAFVAQRLQSRSRSKLVRLAGLEPAFPDWQPSVLASGRQQQFLGAGDATRTRILWLEARCPALGRHQQFL